MSTFESARERWARIIREQAASGLTVAAFCAGRGLAVSSFYPWKRRLETSGHATMRDEAPAFVEATVRGVPDAAGGVTIEVGVARRRVIVSRGFDRRLLLEVLETLESPRPFRAAPGACS